MQLPHGYTNFTALVGQLVEKSYTGQDKLERQQRELLALRQLKEVLPVPVVADEESPPGVIRTYYIAGEHGQDLIERGQAELVLGLCGQLLRRLQQVPVEILAGKLAGEGGGEVIVHGDFGPQNILFFVEKQAVAALLDWEWVHLGNRLEDLAWTEWIIRTHHPTQARGKILAALFEGYGQRPAWDLRHQAMLQSCRFHLQGAITRQDHTLIKLWQDRLEQTLRFEELAS
jgi:aminoglycoside phosphotransferase (APT) family kinase protein